MVAASADLPYPYRLSVRATIATVRLLVELGYLDVSRLRRPGIG
jgi:hypothetical protein